MTEEERLKQEYNDWLADQTPDSLKECLSDEQLKKEIADFFVMAKERSVEEYTLQRKYDQLHDIYNPSIKTSLFGDKEWVVPKGLTKEMLIKNNIWVPENPDDYLDLQPELILCNGSRFTKIYNLLKILISTGENNNNIGRNLYYIVRDKKTQKYLGILNCSSDYLDVKCRDDFIGWNRAQRNGGRINHTTVGSTIVPTQPLGYNYLGGKLMALLIISDQVQKDWKRLYGDVLVGVTTTSLYGSFSQYTGLQYWKKLGRSAGSSISRPEPDLYAKIRQWLKVNDTYRFWEWYHAKSDEGSKLKRDHVNRSLSHVYRQMGFKQSEFITGHQRGVYFCKLYTNTAEFLREDITEDKLVPRFDNSVEALTELWKQKYASKRIKKLVETDSTLNDVLFYDDMLCNDWETIRERYLPQVGR